MDSVEATVTAYFEALNHSDVEQLVGLFAQDAAYMGHEMETLRSQEQIRESFEGIFRAMAFQRDYHVDRVQEASGFATARTHTTGTVRVLSGNNVLSVLSRELFVLRRSSDGWRITDYMFNRAGPPV